MPERHASVATTIAAPVAIATPLVGGPAVRAAQVEGKPDPVLCAIGERCPNDEQCNTEHPAAFKQHGNTGNRHSDREENLDHSLVP